MNRMPIDAGNTDEAGGYPCPAHETATDQMLWHHASCDFFSLWFDSFFPRFGRTKAVPSHTDMAIIGPAVSLGLDLVHPGNQP